MILWNFGAAYANQPVPKFAWSNPPPTSQQPQRAIFCSTTNSHRNTKVEPNVITFQSYQLCGSVNHLSLDECVIQTHIRNSHNSMKMTIFKHHNVSFKSGWHIVNWCYTFNRHFRHFFFVQKPNPNENRPHRNRRQLEWISK